MDVDMNRYSVPWAYVGKQVRVQVTDMEVIHKIARDPKTRMVSYMNICQRNYFDAQKVGFERAEL